VSAIVFKDVTKSFGGVKVLDGVSFTVEKGEIFSIVGPSGTGKSVTLKHIVGLLAPDGGEVEAGSGKIGYLFQSGALMAWLTVAENVALPLVETTSLSRGEIDAKVEKALAAVGLSDAADKYPAEISGGMQKRAGLARAIVRESDIVLYDEPTSGLDPVSTKEVKTLIGALSAGGMTILTTSHLLADAEDICDRVMIVNHGKSVAEGKVSELSVSLEDFFLAKVGNADDFVLADFLA
jgi:phospholipid/cholesterol/gamma-HCH transport system ATP-binding protein